jgi:hypothetical protein
VDNYYWKTEEEWIQEFGSRKREKESMTEMKVQWDSSVVPRIYMIEKEENLRKTL